jgi:hypothetical protein|mmetsp:Transcript_45997/g.77323  ORF Transcript_45997/g.77323 Transcript_45997/m.77323 type:complete len:215 (-) Transcript_45997:1901-2545(-)
MPTRVCPWQLELDTVSLARAPCAHHAGAGAKLIPARPHPLKACQLQQQHRVTDTAADHKYMENAGVDIERHPIGPKGGGVEWQKPELGINSCRFCATAALLCRVKEETNQQNKVKQSTPGPPCGPGRGPIKQQRAPEGGSAKMVTELHTQVKEHVACDSLSAQCKSRTCNGSCSAVMSSVGARLVVRRKSLLSLAGRRAVVCSPRDMRWYGARK